LCFVDESHFERYRVQESELGKKLVTGLGDEKLRKLRLHTATYVGKVLDATGALLPGTLNPKDSFSKDLFAVAIILRMSGELVVSATKLFSSGSHYAGAALLRQLVEIEYLTWNFKEKTRSPASWLDSTHEQRMKDFSPSALRKTSKGRFLFKDYQDHCEQGGHPVLRGAHLLGSGNRDGIQVLIVDMLTHTWRTWDQIAEFAKNYPKIDPIVIAASSKIYSSLKKWGNVDPIYAAMVEFRPANTNKHAGSSP
jgi:hypothetical protein